MVRPLHNECQGNGQGGQLFGAAALSDAHGATRPVQPVGGLGNLFAAASPGQFTRSARPPTMHAMREDRLEMSAEWVEEDADSPWDPAEIDIGNLLGALGTGAATGAATGSVAGPWGAGIGAVLGAGLGALNATRPAPQRPRPPAPVAPSPPPAPSTGSVPTPNPPPAPGPSPLDPQALQQLLAVLAQVLAKPAAPAAESTETVGSPGIEGAPPAEAFDTLDDETAQLSEYPGAARLAWASPDNYRPWNRPEPRAIRRIVIHITDAPPNSRVVPSMNGIVRWFQDPAARVSAHYVVGRDGEVVQMVRHNDIAWHAGNANGDSIGIENIVVPPRPGWAGAPPTDALYCATAALVRWLCERYGLPMDREHIVGHSEADPRTTHTGCPDSAWDWGHFMALVTSGSCRPRQAEWAARA